MLFSYLSFFTFFFCLALGISGILIDPKAKLNRAFFFMSLSSAVWALGYIFVFKENNKETLWFWYRISSIGWLTIFLTMLNFLFVFTNIKKKKYLLIFSIFRIFMIIASAVLIFIQFTKTLFVTGFIMTPYGNAGIIDRNSSGFYLFNITAIITIVLSYTMLISGNKYNHGKRYKIQTIWLTVITSIMFIFPFLFNIILPLFYAPGFPSIGVLFSNFINAGALYMIYRYRLMRLDYGLLKDETFNSLNDMILIISPENKIINVNETFRKATNYIKTDDDDISDIFADKNETIRYISEAVKEKKRYSKNYVMIKGYNKKNIPVSLSICPIFDNFHDYIGSIIICKEHNTVEQIINLYNISPQEKIIIIHLLEGLSSREIGDKMAISAGTVNNYIMNIYKKTNSSNRVELVQLFFHAEDI
jgi:DNA-binding CsgD family transcriptional regulator